MSAEAITAGVKGKKEESFARLCVISAAMAALCVDEASPNPIYSGRSVEGLCAFASASAIFLSCDVTPLVASIDQNTQMGPANGALRPHDAENFH
mgnify:CR=1 FL=1